MWRRSDFQDGTADDLWLRPAVEGFGITIPVQNVAVQIGGNDRLLYGIEQQCLKLALLLRHPLLTHMHIECNLIDNNGSQISERLLFFCAPGVRLQVKRAERANHLTIRCKEWIAQISHHA